MLHETTIDVYRVAEHAKRYVSGFETIGSISICFSLRCLPLLHEHSQRDELLDILVDAGESAWDRGAHEVSEFLVGLSLTQVCFIDRDAIIY